MDRSNGVEAQDGEGKDLFDQSPCPRSMRIIDQYDLRSEIENRGFRELKQGYHLLKYPQKTVAAVRAHAVLTSAGQLEPQTLNDSVVPGSLGSQLFLAPPFVL